MNGTVLCGVLRKRNHHADIAETVTLSTIVHQSRDRLSQVGLAALTASDDFSWKSIWDMIAIKEGQDLM